jgi:2-hydroxycyclohexanecarboxyl-CoA dehydrogenase
VKIGGARVLVTGAGSGIGAATAQHCALLGAEVVAVDIDGEAARATAERCGGQAHRCDVSDRAEMQALAERSGPIDVLVNNAGVGVAGPFLENSIEDWEWLRSINLDGVVYGCHVFGRAMVERGRGHIVNVASLAAYLPNRNMAAYCTAKSGVLMLSQCLRADWSGSGVGVSAICPGVINTPIPRNTRMVGSMARKQARAVRAFDRFGHSPDLVAKAIVRAVERNQDVVAVGVEASIGIGLMRFSPRWLHGLVAKSQGI